MAQRFLRFVGVIGTAAVLVLTAIGSAQAVTRWRIEQRVPDTKTVTNTDFESVATVSTRSVWTVGSDKVNAGARGLVKRPLVERWNGHGWHRFTAPPVPSGAQRRELERHALGGEERRRWSRRHPPGPPRKEGGVGAGLLHLQGREAARVRVRLGGQGLDVARFTP